MEEPPSITEIIELIAFLGSVCSVVDSH